MTVESVSVLQATREIYFPFGNSLSLGTERYGNRLVNYLKKVNVNISPQPALCSPLLDIGFSQFKHHSLDKQIFSRFSFV